MRGVQEEKNDWMTKRKEDGTIGRPLMKPEEVDVAVGPPLERTVAERDEHAEKQVDRYGSNGTKAKIRAEVK